jgi:phosphate transport system permease protein
VSLIRKNKRNRNVKLDRFIDKSVEVFCTVGASAPLLILIGILSVLTWNALPSIKEFGFGFLTSSEWNPVNGKFGALSPILGTLVTALLACLFAVPVALGCALYLSEFANKKVRVVIGSALEMLAGVPSVVYGMWGLIVFAPFMGETVQPFLASTLGKLPVVGSLFQGAMSGTGFLTAGLILALMILPLVALTIRDAFDSIHHTVRESSRALGSTPWETAKNVVIPARMSAIAGALSLGLTRALGETMAVAFVIGNAWQVPKLSIFSAGTTLSTAIANEFAEADGKLHTGALMKLGLVLFAISLLTLGLGRLISRYESKHIGSGGGICLTPKKLCINRDWRNFKSKVGVFVCGLSAFVAFASLTIILSEIVIKGFSSLGMNLFTMSTPAPGSEGGLANAFVGSLMMVFGGLLIGGPVGIAGGVWMNEYAQGQGKFKAVARMGCDLLMASPSIVIGLFVWAVCVVPFGHFSGWAGAIALATVIAPICMRQTEIALKGVRPEVREAVAAMGAPKYRVLLDASLRGARFGLITAVLLALARAGGESAPLLFTALSNNFFTTNMNGAMASVPTVLFQFGLSPYENWVGIAWAGALVIGLWTLGLGLLAVKVFSPKTKESKPSVLRKYIVDLWLRKKNNEKCCNLGYELHENNI